ncbi:DUF5777 family beta-barrel protein [Terrimonas sp. NA20]|uniref:DUF5777 family beta-barrel protein n=1 Tax=Terrimonas ginsenosidimutans TaxID=2908004 RepID=A0ABS9KQ53_9BACT|nr:DUF5777 family beta-barrel protein [Terrimonas ginsenosidimutans]MCG2614442.1 DUF5777 family beta-barrel protein [Terrimonas ginsenosidimutans]
MKNRLVLMALACSQYSNAQDSTAIATPVPAKDVSYVWLFSSPRLINANTVELIPKHVLEFKVTHNFGDIAGDNGGGKTFFGLDNATDVRIGFQYGLSKRINLIAARAKGAGSVQQLYELGIKYRLMQQAEDAQHPVSVTLFANNVISAMTRSPLSNQENSFDDFIDRNSQTVQLMIGRRFGNLSLQLSPTMVNRNFVPSNDDQTMFALGGAFRLPVKGRFSVLVDYFHTFRSQQSKDFYKTQGVNFYDALGVGIELLTAGHVFHLNFTNATEILENRFIPRTVTSWGKGQFRWGFTVSRDFNLFYKKKKRK